MKDHSNQDKIEYNSFGCVAFCDGCRKIKLGFGNVFFNFSRKEFFEFSSFISGTILCNREEMVIRGHKLFIQTEAKGMMIMLNLNEMEQLNDLLQQAEIQLEIKEILQTK